MLVHVTLYYNNNVLAVSTTPWIMHSHGNGKSGRLEYMKVAFNQISSSSLSSWEGVKLDNNIKPLIVHQKL